MAMSLEDLLAEEGFKRRKEKMKGRASFASHDRQESASLLSVRRTERTRSDIPRSDFKAEFSTSSSFSGRKPRDNLTRREKMDREQLADKGRLVVNNGRRSHVDSLDAKRFSIASEITEVIQSDGIVEEGMNKVYTNSKQEREKQSATSYEGKERYKNDIMMDKNNSFRHTYPHASQGNKFGESRSIRQNQVDEVEAAPALDEAAIKAIISIFSGHAKRFLDDEDFRISLHHNTFASLNLTGVDTESKVVENLEQAIETVERAAEESATLKELKRASLQLSVITGLNSDDLKDGFTSGVPNLRLSASAHLYLSIIYVLQKKDKVAAKHLLQVFCDSPFQARTILLPDLWDQVFLPHLLPLKVWYDKETHTATDSPIFVNLKLLNATYNQSLDSGTYQFAMYYKDWMIDGVEAPSVPLINIPSFSVQLMLRGEGVLGHTSSPASHVSPQPMVSKHLYDEVFKHSEKPAAESQLFEEEEEEEEEEEKFDSNSARSSNSPAPEDKQLILCIHDSEIKQANKQVEPACKSPSGTEGDAMQKNELKPPVREFEEKYEYCIGKPFECSIPEDFVCPLTGLVFKDPVTLETGETFEREAIAEWFSKGCFTCPVTRKILQYEAVPPTNLILKRIIYRWKTDHIEHLLALLSQATSGCGENVQVNGDNTMMVCILGQLLPVFSKEERVVYARRLISFGGLKFLLIRFDTCSAQEKTFILALLCCCIDADSGCRNWIARNINQSNLLELLHSEHLISRKNAVVLLSELICFNRRSIARWFLEGVGDEEILNALDDMSIYLQTCPLEQTPLVAILILHLDLLSDRGHRSKMYREEAVDALATALMRSLTDSDSDSDSDSDAEKLLQNKCCKALLILGGFFSSSGKLMTEDWILKLAGFLNCPDWKNDTDTLDGTVTTVDSVKEDKDDDDEEEEESAREKWLTSLSASLVGGKKSSFLEAVSKCLSSGKSSPDLVRVCLTTVAWLSFSLANSCTSQTQYQLLSAFSALISPLNRYLQRGVLVEQRILASLSLLNFTTIPECRILVMKIGDEIGSSLDDLAEVTWTASELYTIIYGQTKGGTT